MADSAATSTAPLVPAAQYVRMSAEHQRYSADNQAAAIELYALAHGYEIVRTYADLGRSGLTLIKRPALQQLLADVQVDGVGFRAILVYDVSRWGRFQDPDEAAECEAVCKRSGVTVHYCAEPFENDGSATSSILKALKRVMAAEYSRELSEKVYTSLRRVAGFGFVPTRWRPLGLRRLAVNYLGQPVRLLDDNEPNLRGCRVTLVPGPDHEVALVLRIFRLFGQRGWSLSRIARTLNAEGVRNPHGDLWRYAAVGRLLRCEAYVGNYVYGKTTARLRSTERRIPPAAWIRVEGAFEPIVGRRLFNAVQKRLANAEPRSDAKMLEDLRGLLERRGYLTAHLLKAERGVSRRDSYAKRFGSLTEAYRLVGYQPRSVQQMSALIQTTQLRRNRLINEAADSLRAAGCSVLIDRCRSRLETDCGLVIDVRARRPTADPRLSWYYYTHRHAKAPLTLVTRLDHALQPFDYCLLSVAGFRGRPGVFLPTTVEGWAGIEAFTSLDELHDRCMRLLGSGAPNATAAS